MPQIQVTPTPAESKRLIAKAVAALPKVGRAMREGIVIIAVGSTNAYVAEELLGREIEREKFLAGVVLPSGTCMIPRERRMTEIVVRRGEVLRARMMDVMGELGPGDVLIKSANALDAQGMAGIMMGARDGGTIGRSIGALLARGVNIIIPTGLEKLIPGSVWEVARIAGIDRTSYSMGLPSG